MPQYRHQYSRICPHCEKAFSTWNKAAKYCSVRCRTDAATARRIREPTCWLNIPMECGICNTKFFRTLNTGPNKKYCSPECSIRARRSDHRRFMELAPGAMEAYNRQRAKNHGSGTLITRLRKRYPDLPKVCETPSCSESRVLEIAHKPEHKRNGAWRTMDWYERHMFWMLCPTCHAVLDLGIETPEQMGLVSPHQKAVTPSKT